MRKPFLSICSGTVNRLPLLQTMMGSALAAMPNGITYEFVLCDGGSSDGTIAWLKSRKHTTLIEHGSLRGAVRAFTDAAKMARGKYVILANDDVAFMPDSIIRALVHLENNPECGAVAFEDNRPVPPWHPDNTQFHTLPHPAWLNGHTTQVIYAQVGMFRNWLGQRVGWWGADDPDFAAYTYAGDNYLSSKVWELGYKVEAVPGARVFDEVYKDALRAVNGGESGAADSAKYYAYPAWLDPQTKQHRGAVLQPIPVIPNEDGRNLRTLYLPIIERYDPSLGASVQKIQKHGLKDALAEVGIVHELDYVNIGQAKIDQELNAALDSFQPDVLFTQLHDAEYITPPMLRAIRERCPRLVVINWNGDTHLSHLIDKKMLDLLRYVDLQLIVNLRAVDTYKQYGIISAYWQCAYEPVDETALPDVPKYDIVFQGSAYNEHRKELGRRLRAKYGAKLGLYGDYWGDGDNPAGAQGRNLYDFAQGRALYRNAKLCIGSNEYPDDYGFVSNRIWEALINGESMLLHQPIPGLTELTGLTPDKHFVEWTDLDDLEAKLEYWLDPKQDKRRRKIAQTARVYVMENHSFSARVKQLFNPDVGLLMLAKKQPRIVVAFKYIGRRTDSFGVMGQQTRTSYNVNPTAILHVDPLDADGFLGEPTLWQKVEDEQSTMLMRQGGQ